MQSAGPHVDDEDNMRRFQSRTLRHHTGIRNIDINSISKLEET